MFKFHRDLLGLMTETARSAAEEPIAELEGINHLALLTTDTDATEIGS